MICKDHQTDRKRLPYLQWHDRADDAHRRGERQLQCDQCKRWYFPWERKWPRTPK